MADSSRLASAITVRSAAGRTGARAAGAATGAASAGFPTDRRRGRRRDARRGGRSAFAISVTMMTVCLLMMLYLMSTGVGVWGLDHPVMWGWAIVNFVWWIGIGHAGTLISAILFLLRQTMAHFDQPRGRSDDDFRRDVRGHFPAHSHRARFGSAGGCSRSPIPTASGRNSARR